MPDIPGIYFLVNSKCWGQAYILSKLESTPLGHRQRGQWTNDILLPFQSF